MRDDWLTQFLLSVVGCGYVLLCVLALLTKGDAESRRRREASLRPRGDGRA